MMPNAWGRPTVITNIVAAFQRLDRFVAGLDDDTLDMLILRAYPNVLPEVLSGKREKLRELGARAMYQSSFVDQNVARIMRRWIETEVTLGDLGITSFVVNFRNS